MRIIATVGTGVPSDRVRVVRENDTCDSTGGQAAVSAAADVAAAAERGKAVGARS
ncbi:MAG: hypothetical protein HYZ04_02620 [Rhodospirillales bacterium]|nr:hypothetical protein [Rhodospirillales bacterium]